MTKYLYFLTLLAILVCGCSEKNTTNLEQEAYNWSKKNFRNDLDSTLVLIDKIKLETKDLYWFAKFEYLLAAIELRSGDNVTGLRRSIQALEVLKSIESHDLELYYGLTRNIAAMQTNLGDFESSLIAYEESIELAEKVGRPQLVIDYARLNFAVSKINTNKFDEGNKEILSLYRDSSLPVKLAAAIELGKNARDLKEYDLAIDEYFSFVVINDADSSNYGNAELEIAKTYAEQGMIPEANKYFDLAYNKMVYKQNGKLKPYEEGRFKTLLAKGKMSLSIGDPEAASKCFTHAIQHWDFGEKMLHIEVFDYLSESLVGIDIQKSIEYKEKYRDLRDLRSKNQRESNRQASIRATEFQAESIRLITLQKEEQRKLVKQLLVLSLIVLSLLTVIGYGWRRYVSEQKNRRDKVNFALAKLTQMEKS